MGKFNRAKQFNKKEFGKTTKFKETNMRDKEFNNRKPETNTGFQLHHAICDKCGRDCDIPFKPTGGKPIYCRSCFRANDSEKPSKQNNNYDKRRPNNYTESRDRFEQRGTPQSVTAEDIEKINKKLDKIIKALKI
ncbi:MAG: CxxC-x17-CxxC domain-containing protein [Candidatus Woesearchaeota archaeon]